MCFSPLISHMFLITCERLCQPVCEILLYLPLCLHTSTHTHGSSVLKRQSSWEQRPREKCVCVLACVTEGGRERHTAPPLAAQGVNTVDYNEAPLTDLLLPSAPPHAHLISLPPPFLTHSPPFSFLPLSVREGIQCAVGASFNKVKCRASVRKISSTDL